MGDPIISIIVPVYNQVKYIERCCKSLIGQTLKQIQILLVDDGSTDGSSEICDNFAKIDDRINVIHKANGGVSSAWITGVKVAKGNIIGFMDPDDYCEQDYYETLYKAMKEDDSDIVACGYIWEKENGTVIDKVFPSKVLIAKTYREQELEQIKCNFYKNEITLLAAKWLKIIKKELICDNLTYFDERIGFGDDIGITYATFCDAKQVKLIEYYGYHYVLHESSITHKLSKRLLADTANLLRNLNTLATEKKYSSDSVYKEQYKQLMAVVSFVISSKEKAEIKKDYLSDIRRLDEVNTLITAKKISKDVMLKIRVLAFLFKYKLFAVMVIIMNLKSQIFNKKKKGSETI